MTFASDEIIKENEERLKELYKDLKYWEKRGDKRMIEFVKREIEDLKHEPIL